MKQRCQTNSTSFALSHLLFVVFFISCNDHSSNEAKLTAQTAIAPAGDSTQQADRFFYTVELSKTALQNIVRTIPLNGNGKRKGKLIFQFSSPNITAANAFFDLAVYATGKHKDYAENVVPVIGRATNPYLKIETGVQYIFGNNEISLQQLKSILRNVQWTKIVLHPAINDNRQLVYLIIPYNGTTALKDVNGILPANVEYFTNPSPPAKPPAPEDEPNNQHIPDTMILNDGK